MKFTAMDTGFTRQKNLLGVDKKEISALLIRFQEWHQCCLNHGYNIGPINETVFRLWCDLAVIVLCDESVANILRCCDLKYQVK